MPSGRITASAVSLTIFAAALPVRAQTAIDFDGVAPGVAITDQFPEATFSSDPGSANFVLASDDADSGPNILCSGDQAFVSCIEPTYVDFQLPVDGLTFAAVQANAPGVTARFRVFEEGTLAATVDFVSSGGTPNNELVDLSGFSSVTRLEIVDILDDPLLENGIGWDTFRFVPVGLGLSVKDLAGGAAARFTVFGATPLGQVVVVLSTTGPGPAVLDVTGCGSISLATEKPRFVGGGMADANGRLRLSVPIPPSATGLPVWFDALDLDSCETTAGLADTIG